MYLSRSTFNESKDYTEISNASGTGSVERQVWSRESGSGGSDLFRRAVDSLVVPYAKIVAGQGYRFSPTRFGERFGLTKDVVVQYDTVVIGKENYDGYINRAVTSENSKAGGESWFGQSIRQGLERAATRLDSESGQDSAASVSDASGEVSEAKLSHVQSTLSDENGKQLTALWGMLMRKLGDSVFRYPRSGGAKVNALELGMEWVGILLISGLLLAATKKD